MLFRGSKIVAIIRRSGLNWLLLLLLKAGANGVAIMFVT